jgi:uncharacterized protein
MKIFTLNLLAISLNCTGAVMADPPPQSSAPAAPTAEHDVADGPAAGASEHRFTNRLINETSPYLLQHAHNPVDWHPWGREAFDEARKRKLPIFLSVGYSTCYWCHVMERESFEDEATATYLNEHFIAIKVDREERPDVDDIYMTAVQLLTQSGGWPMSVFLTPPGSTGEDDPGLKPFWGGTYFPKESKGNYPSFMQVLTGLRGAWADQHDEVLKQADMLADAMRSQLAQQFEPVHIGAEQIDTARDQLMKIYDSANGGFGAKPKFPQPVFIEFLLDELPTINDEKLRASVESAVRHTLDRMAIGGMDDQVGGGFHRYSTDDHWLVPHFEKMLYDNAQLADVYTRAAGMFDDSFYERIARRTLDYVLREMTSSAGVFFSAQDAEVNGLEGENYLWRLAEMRNVLSPGDAEFANAIYGLDAGTNFRDPHHADSPPSNVLRLAERPDVLAKNMNMTTEALLDRLDSVNAKLYEARAKKDQPRLDDKTIVSWNGLMIAALARAGAQFDEPRYLDAAQLAADSILANMRDDAGGLLRIARGGDSKTPAFFEDYAFFIKGLVALSRADSANDKYLTEAVKLADVAKERFGDSEFGGYFDTLAGQSDLIVRTKQAYDGALPSGQSIMIHDLLDLAQLTGEARFRDDALRTIASMSQTIGRSPLAPIEATRGLLRVLNTDSALLDAFGMGADAQAAAINQPNFASPAPGAEPPVQVFASQDSAVVSIGNPATVELELRIADGFHINAHEPDVDYLVGLTVSAENGTGVRAVVDYPIGSPLQTQWAAKGEQPMVHAGDLRLSVRLERTDDAWAGTPTLVVSYQACTDTACQAPAKVELGIAIKAKE